MLRTTWLWNELTFVGSQGRGGIWFGGHVAVPAYLAAKRRKTPLLIHEKDVPVGVANRLGLRLTPHVGLGFPLREPAEQLNSAQLAHRHFWRRLDIGGRTIQAPGPPFGLQIAAY